jgi:prepilin-type N-terminal cleavage/methylation domain-containing protein
MDQRMTAPGNVGERGFTMVEVLIALLILLLGMAGVLSLQLTSLEATAFSRHATEASVLAEDKMEALRTQPTATLVSDSDTVDARGVPDPNGLYAREWTVAAAGEDTSITVEVSWLEQGNAAEPYRVTMNTLRTP